MRLARYARFAIPLIIVTVLVVGFLFLADPLFNLDFGIIVDKRTATSDIVALVGRDLMSLNTVEAVYKVVFPYDFIPTDVNWRLFLTQVESGRPLTVEEQRYLEVYHLASDIGIDLTTKRNDFVVITAIAKIGLDLDRFSDTTRKVVNGRIGPVSLRSDGTVIISLPPVAITELIIDDSSSADYGYPDVRVTPDGWRKISAFVTDSVSDRIADSGLFDEARDGAKRFLSIFFSEAGYESVKFAE